MPKKIADESPQKNLPDQIVDFFLALIFIGDIKARDKLPSEVELSKILHVNQSSLRMAIRVLTRMKVIESTRGSGFVVMDYKKHSGLNFYTELLQIPELYLGTKFLLSLLDQAPSTLALLMQSVSNNNPIQNSLGYLAVLEQQILYLEQKQSPKKIAELDIKIQNAASAEIKNPILQATFNSFAPLRNYIMEMYYSIEGNHLAHVENQKAIWTSFIRNEISEEEFHKRYLALISEEVKTIQQHLKSQTQEPRLLRSPLQHYPDLLGLGLNKH